MTCSKYGLTNTGTTAVNFNYQRCEDFLWEYQVNLNPTLSLIPVPSTSLTADPETKLLMNTLLASSVFTDTSGTQSSITINSGTVIYLVDSPY